jgi:hypothetical protein
MDAKPLPARPSLKPFTKRERDIVRSCTSGDHAEIGLLRRDGGKS